jgi:hypothetical protein
MIAALTSKRTAVILVLTAASIVLVAVSREWVFGSVDEAGLGASSLQGRGSDIAPGAVAAALVGLASAVAAATSGPVVRVVAACTALLAAALGTTVVISVLADPGGALGTLAAAGTGRSGNVVASGRAGAWAFVAFAAMLVMGIGGLGALVGGRRWHGLSSSYDAPTGGPGSVADSSGEPAGRPESAWDQLSRGQDPTAENPTAENPTAEQPTAEQPTAEQPTAAESAAEEPTAEH